MPKRGQMLNRLTDTVQVVDTNVADAGTRRTNVDKYQWHLAQFEILEQHLLHAERHNGNTFDTAFDHPPDCCFHMCRIISGRGEHDFEMMLNCNALKYLDDLGKERIGDLRNDEAENPASSGNERSSLGVGIVAEFFDDVPYSLSELGIDSRDSIDGARDGRCRNSCAFCDFPNIHEMGACTGGTAFRKNDDIKLGNRLRQIWEALEILNPSAIPLGQSLRV